MPQPKDPAGQAEEADESRGSRYPQESFQITKGGWQNWQQN